MQKLKIERRSGNIDILIIIFVALALVSLFVSYFFFINWQKMDQQARLKKQWADDIKRKRIPALRQRIQYITNLTGFFEEGVGENKVDLNKLIEKLNRLNSDEEKPGTKRDYQLLDLSGKGIEYDKLTSINYGVKLDAAITAFERRVEQLNEEIAQLDFAIQDQLHKEGLLKIHVEGERKQYQERMRAKKEILSRLMMKRTKLKEKFESMLAKVKQEYAEAEMAKKAEEKKRAELEQARRDQKVEYENKISKTRTKIRELQARKYGKKGLTAGGKAPKFYNPGEGTPDGEIVFTDYRNKIAYINLGRKDGVMKGLKFDVYRRSHGGTRTLKGRVEIRKIMDQNTSMVTIVSTVAELDPIVPGDKLINPIFAKGQKINVALVGSLTRFRSSKVAKEEIEQLGAKVQSDVNSYTNLVILGSKDYKNDDKYLQAVDLGLELMTEESLLRYIGD